MVRLFFRREKSSSTPSVSSTVEESADELSSSESEPRFNNQGSNLHLDQTNMEEDLDVSVHRKPVDFAAAGRMKWALRTVLNDIDKLEVENEIESRTGFADLKRKLLDSMGSENKQDDDDEASRNSEDDDVEAIDSNPNWILSPQQVFDLTMSTLRAQIETLEERNNFISRIRLLEQQLDEQRGAGRSVQDSKAAKAPKAQKNHQSTDMVQLMHQVATLQQELHESRATIDKLQQERDAHKKAVTELSRVLRASDPGADDACRLAQDAESPRQAEDEIKPERALYLTIHGLKKKIEALEDERYGFTSEIHNLAATLNELKEEKDARELKISVLEGQFEAMEKQFQVMDDAMREGPLTCYLIPSGNTNV